MQCQVSKSANSDTCPFGVTRAHDRDRLLYVPHSLVRSLVTVKEVNTVKGTVLANLARGDTAILLYN